MEDLELTGCPEWVDDDGTLCALMAEVNYTIPANEYGEEMKMVNCVSGMHRMLVPVRYLVQFTPTLEQELAVPARELL